MAPIPERVALRLDRVCDATGVSKEQAWAWQSKATRVAANPSAWRKRWHGLTLARKASLKNKASWWLRPKQLLSNPLWFICLVLAGRGWGKTHSGAAWVIEQARQFPKSRGALVGATAADVRDTMITGPSGIIALSPPDFQPVYEPSKGWLTWPNGSWAKVYTADKPARLRGPNLNWAWVDELAAFRYPRQAWDMLMFCLRRGKNPQVVVTTTPRPIELIQELWKRTQEGDAAVNLVRGSTWENWFHLPQRYFDEVISKATGNQKREEVDAEVLSAIEGALFSKAILDYTRVRHGPVDYGKIVVAVDPAISQGPDSDEHGIAVLGRGLDLHGYIIEDASLAGSPRDWARRAYELYVKYEADCIVVERNRGGDMVAHTIRSVVREGEPRPRIVEVTATKGKAIRSSFLVAIFEEGRFHIVGNDKKALEHEMTSWVPGVSPWSPNRFDAVVWAAHELFKPGQVNN